MQLVYVFCLPIYYRLMLNDIIQLSALERKLIHIMELVKGMDLLVTFLPIR